MYANIGLGKIVSLNKVIKTLIGYNLFLLLDWGLITPILAVFITDHIRGGYVRVPGIAIGIYWLTKSIIQLPIARYLDKSHGEKDDFYALICGTILVSLVPLGFIFASPLPGICMFCRRYTHWAWLL